MKKRSLAVLMAGVMAASMMTGVVSVYADADSKTLTVGFDAEYPPFGYKDDNGEYVGFDLDLAQEVCDNLGWELVKKPINWDSKDMEQYSIHESGFRRCRCHRSRYRCCQISAFSERRRQICDPRRANPERTVWNRL